MITHPCGCVTDIDPEWQVTHSIKKCAHHTQPQRDGYEHFAVELGRIKDNIPQCKTDCRTFDRMFSMLGRPLIGRSPRGVALEVGCGMSLYAPLIMQRNYHYTGVDISQFCCDWTAGTFNVETFCQPFETFTLSVQLDLILSAHTVEHFEHSPNMIKKMHDLLVPNGLLYLILPDDTDLCNPDHRWFYNQQTLQATLERVGFWDVKMHQVVADIPWTKENWIYAFARKSRHYNAV